MTSRTKYNSKSGDVFDGQPKDANERAALGSIVSEQMQQHSGNPDEYGYAPTRWHHYWGIMDGQWQILTRTPDDRHPANGRWECWKNPPEGVEPARGDWFDQTNT
jgi:hypothetical protein